MEQWRKKKQTNKQKLSQAAQEAYVLIKETDNIQ